MQHSYNFFKLKQIVFNKGNELKLMEALYQKVSQDLSKYYVTASDLSYISIRFHVDFSKKPHQHRIKILYKQYSLCSVYKDNNNVIFKGNQCNKVPKIIRVFLNQYVTSCWDRFQQMVDERNAEVLDELRIQMKIFKKNGKVSC